MQEQFLRQLTVKLSREEAERLLPLLHETGVEVYNAADPHQFVSKPEDAAEGGLFVPKADYEQAAAILQENGLAEWLRTTLDTSAEQKKGTDGARHLFGTGLSSADTPEDIEAAFYRKHRLHMLEWVIIFIAVFVFGLIRGLMQ